jgi:hypothetical protein
MTPNGSRLESLSASMSSEHSTGDRQNARKPRITVLNRREFLGMTAASLIISRKAE